MPDTEIISPKWKFKTAGEVSSSPVVSGGVVYFGCCDKHLYAVDSKTGEEKWKFNTGDGGVDSSPVVSDGVVYFGSYDFHFYAVNIKTGGEKWKFETGDCIYSTTVSDGVVYFGGDDTCIYAYDMKMKNNILLKRKLMSAIWDKAGHEIYIQTYETEVTHEEAEYIQGALGCKRLEEVDSEADDYDPEKMEKIRIEVENYIDDNYRNDFFEYVNSDDLENGLLSKDEIEDWISRSLLQLCEFFSTFTVKGGFDDNEDKIIYLEVGFVDYTLNELNPEWTDDEYYLDDEKMENFIDEIM